MADKPKKAEYPRQVGEKWQSRNGNLHDTWHGALRDFGPSKPSPAPSAPDPAPERASKLRGRLTIGLVIAACGFLLVKADLWRSTTNRQLCGWTIVMVEAPAGGRARGESDGQDCYIMSGDVRASFRLFNAPNDTMLDTDALKERYQRSTGGSTLPSPEISWGAALSVPDLIWNNRLRMIVYEAPDRRRGYILVPITERIALGGVYASDRPQTVESLQDAVRLRLNPSGRARGVAIWAKIANAGSLIFLILPLALVTGARQVFHWFDRWWDLQTRLGLILYCTIVPGFLVLWTWGVIFISGWGTLSFASLLIALIGIALVIFHLGRDRRIRVPLKPFNAPELTVFNMLRVTETQIDIGGAEIPTGKNLGVDMWVPRRANCPSCKLSYAVYVPTQAERSISFTANSIDDIPLKTRQELYIEAFQVAPSLTNGCIRCRHQLDDSSPTPPARKGPFPVTILWGIVAIICLGLAALIFWRGPTVMEFLEGVLGTWFSGVIGDFAGLVAFCLAAPALYLLWRTVATLSDLHLSRGSSLRRMSACPSEGIVFEDIHAARDMTCPSCKEDREPIRHFRVVAN